MNLNNIPVKGARALMLGITFKEIYPVKLQTSYFIENYPKNCESHFYEEYPSKCSAYFTGDCPDTSEAKSRTRPDIRNTKAIDIYHELKDYGITVDVYDPWAKPEEVKHEYGITSTTQEPALAQYSAVILAVAHNEFNSLDFGSYHKRQCVIYDVKGILDRAVVDERL